jgi:type I restriction enzyme S subunit
VTTRTERVDEVATVFNGKTPSKAQQRDSGHPVLKIKDVDALGRWRGTFSGHVDDALAQKHERQQLRGGETLILNAAHSATHVASKTFWADAQVAGCLATGEWLIVRWDSEVTDPRFGHNWINAPETRFRVRRLVNGIHLYPKDVSRLNIPLPPLAEQKRIAGILDAADALRAKRRDSIEQLDRLLQSTFLAMFGDPVTNPMGWEVRSIKETGALVQIGPFGSLLHKDEYVQGGVPLINPKHLVGGVVRVGTETVTEAKAKNLSNYRLQVADVIVGRRGEMGRCAVITVETAGMLCGTGSLFIRPDPETSDSVFLWTLLSSASMKAHLERLASGVTMANLNRTKIESLVVPVPPLHVQRRFAAIVESVGQQQTRLQAHLTELDTLFASLQSRAFQGEL